jgi:hypothetical protein
MLSAIFKAAVGHEVRPLLARAVQRLEHNLRPSGSRQGAADRQHQAGCQSYGGRAAANAVLPHRTGISAEVQQTG